MLPNESPAAERNCLICKLPCHAVGHQWHDECTCCVVCKKEVSHDIVMAHVNNEKPLAHSPCWDEKMALEISTKSVTLTQGHLDYLNTMRFMVEADMELNDETNIQTGEIYTRRWMHTRSMDQVFVSLKKMQAACAQMSIALARDREAIQKRRSAQDAEKMIAVHSARNHSEKVKIEKKERSSPEYKRREKAISAMMQFGGYSREEAQTLIESRNKA